VEQSSDPISCVPGCHAPVPTQLQMERLCVLHFLLGLEHTCADMRRETVVGGSSAARRTEIAFQVKAMAEKLSHVALISPALTDEMKKRVLTALLTLMNLQESLDRSTMRNAPGPKSVKPAAASPFPRLAIVHG
jgi:hypothetical protein